MDLSWIGVLSPCFTNRKQTEQKTLYSLLAAKPNRTNQLNLTNNQVLDQLNESTQETTKPNVPQEANTNTGPRIPNGLGLLGGRSNSKRTRLKRGMSNWEVGNRMSEKRRMLLSERLGSRIIGGAGELCGVEVLCHCMLHSIIQSEICRRNASSDNTILFPRWRTAESTSSRSSASLQIAA